MSNVDVIRNYYKRFFSGPARHSEVASLLTENFSFRDPLMTADSRDEYVERLIAFGDELDMQASVREIVGEGDLVSALIEFRGPTGPMTYSHWFTMEDGKIARIESVYDPRPFLSQS